MTSAYSVRDLLPMAGSSNKMPRIGFGVYNSPPDITIKSVTTALDSGYRHIDTAQYYENEAEVGKAIKASGVPRSEIFVTTKIINPVQDDVEKTLESCRSSVKKIGDYVDMFLIHTPSSGEDGRKIMWTALEKLKAEGLAKDIGVSNFGVKHLEQLKKFSSTVPANNQIELHPFCQQTESVKYCKDNGIVLTAYAPIVRNERSDDKTLVAIAKEHGKEVTQVLIKWSVQRGFVPLPKSDTPSRIKQNIEMDGWSLTDAEIEKINTLDEGAKGATAPHPVNCD